MEKDNECFKGGVENSPGVRKRKLIIEGSPICVYEGGRSYDRTIVMLHGAMYGCARFDWDMLYPKLCEDYHVYAIDLPRHGDSRPWTGFLSRERLIKILDDIFTELSLDRFSIVGLSMGGGLAIEYNALHPHKVESLVLFEPGGLSDHLDYELIIWLYIQISIFTRYLSSKYIRMDDKDLTKILESLFVGGSKPRDPERLLGILKDEISGKYENKENDLDDWQISAIGPCRTKWTLLEEVSAVRCPVLLLRGKDSVLVKQKEMERAFALVQSENKELIVIPGGGHLLPLEQPEESYRVIKRFFGKINI